MCRYSGMLLAAAEGRRHSSPHNGHRHPPVPPAGAVPADPAHHPPPGPPPQAAADIPPTGCGKRSMPPPRQTGHEILRSKSGFAHNKTAPAIRCPPGSAQADTGPKRPPSKRDRGRYWAPDSTRTAPDECAPQSWETWASPDQWPFEGPLALRVRPSGRKSGRWRNTPPAGAQSTEHLHCPAYTTDCLAWPFCPLSSPVNSILSRAAGGRRFDSSGQVQRTVISAVLSACL